MSDTKWTPGPWKARGKEVVAYNGQLVKLYRAQIVVVGGWTDYPGEMTSRNELEANAHLISAAPDLYEALEAALYKTTPDWQNMALAALAKARGEEA